MKREGAGWVGGMIDSFQSYSGLDRRWQLGWLSALVLPAVFILLWWLREAHEVYGDEATHIALVNQLWGAISQRGLAGALHFDERYPALFYFFASPWIFAASDPVFGGRVFSGLVWLLALAILYRLALGISAAPFFSCVVVLLAAGVAHLAETARYFLVDGLVGLLLVASLAALVGIWRAPTPSRLIVFSILAGCGLLVKFSYPIYILPSLFGLGVCVVFSPQRRTALRQALGGVSWGWIPAAGILLVAVYWYADQLFVSRSAVGGLEAMVDSGHLIAYRSPSELAIALGRYAWLHFKVLLLLLALGAAIRAIEFAVARRSARVEPSFSRARGWRRLACDFPLGAGLLGAAFIPIALHATGLGAQHRWHMEYWYLLLLLSVLYASLRTRAGKAWFTGASVCVAVAMLTSLWVVKVPQALNVSGDLAEWLGRPNPTGVGGRDIARSIANDWRRRSGPENRVRVFFLYHDHRGPHASSVGHYLRWALPQAQVETDAGAFFDRPIRLDAVLNADYLVIRTEPASSNLDDAETRRYLGWLRASDGFLDKFGTTVESVAGRHGVYQIVRLDKLGLDCVEVARQIERAAQLDGEGRFKNYYDRLRSEVTARFACERANYQRLLNLAPRFEPLAMWGGKAKAAPQGQGEVVVGPGPGHASVLHQKVAVEAGQKYLLVARAKSGGEGNVQGRIQINWFDASFKFLSTSIEVIRLGPVETLFERYLTAPAGAVLGLVYVAPHGKEDVAIYSEMSVYARQEPRSEGKDLDVRTK